MRASASTRWSLTSRHAAPAAPAPRRGRSPGTARAGAESSVSSGWKAQASIEPWRTTTGCPSKLGEHLDLGAVLLDPRRADEHRPQRLGAETLDLEVGLEARAAGARTRCAARVDVHQPEVRRDRARSSRRRSRAPAVPAADVGADRRARARRARSPSTIVVLSPPGITSPSRSAELLGRCAPRPAVAPSERSIAACAAKSPWVASTPIRPADPRCAGRRVAATLPAAVLEQAALGGELARCRRRASARRARRRPRRPRSGSSKWVVASTIARARRSGSSRLEDPRADEVALGAELHHQRRVGRRRDPAGAEQRHRQPAALGDLADELERRAQLLRRARQLLARPAMRAA